MEASEIMAYESINGIKTSLDSPTSSIRTSTPSYFYLPHSADHVKNEVSSAPMLVLSNTNQGTIEANVLLEKPAFVNMDVQALAQANLIAHTQEMLAQQLIQDSAAAERKKIRSKNNKVFKCESKGCGKVFSSINYKHLHEASHTASKSLICDYKDCGRKFLWPAHLNYHRLTHTNDRQYTCNFNNCGKKFFTSQRLKIHMLTHTGEKPFKCVEEGCNKSFTTAGNLRNHIRIHTGEKPYACEYEGCLKRFAEYSSLKKHKLVHSGEKPFTCNICGKSFSQTGTRSAHMRSHHSPAVKHRLIKVAEVKVDIDPNRETQEVMVFSQPAESITHFQGLTDQVVTITTQKSEDVPIQNVVSHQVLGAEEVLGGGDLCTEQLCDKSVAVLTQPQDIITLSSTYPSNETNHEEIVYDNDLLSSHLDHEEIQVSNTNLCLEQSSADMNVSDGIMTSQSVSVMTTQESLSNSADTGKEMAMDPMMESDDEIDIKVET